MLQLAANYQRKVWGGLCRWPVACRGLRERRHGISFAVLVPDMQDSPNMPPVLARNVQAIVDDDACDPLALAPSHQPGLLLVDREAVALDQLSEVRVQDG
jgi:hypothetical protein